MILPDAFLARPIAHRALHEVAEGRPENSRAAVRAAMERGLPVELDLQLSADGRAMVFHDYELDRLTAETGPVALRPADALRQITLRGGAQGIPSLRDILELVDGRVPLLLEIKDQDGAMGPGVGRLEAALAQDLAPYAGPVAIMSFNPHSVAEIARLLPDLPRGLTTCAYDAEDWPLLPEETRRRLRGIPDFERVGASFISHQARDLSARPVAALREAGVPILCWTIRSEASETEARALADNITFEGYDPG
ncbi:glycerophosphodiester phosphodiesterase family protein [Poseidonocella sedimentorum]|uniref:Glycerophosphoryl diester phosphodiesterase n=1 Tax=Poseidonocella sedimentorum TaxID=871652 RepID=A0A1I6D851_9RHOB|nr:glycerophosphodiester phosphodiesterase family protein [Poseidonocella sedimentorum]SFR01646.1 Glycerophosphoryl diester phosphodiesterase [Poseidonocella sedimentorum]